jgi:hypothetical protein
MVNEYVVEVRYKAKPKVLDYRGSWAEIISENLELPEWNIGENRLDLWRDERRVRAFVGYRNTGFIVKDGATPQFFIDHSTKFLSFVFSLTGFDNAAHVERIGVRCRFMQKVDGDFASLVKKFSERYVVLSERARKVVDAELVDIGAPLNFKDALGQFNTIAGPMRRAQAEEYFPDRDEIPEVGLYYDIDYWTRPDEQLKGENIVKSVRAFWQSAESRRQGLYDLIVNDKA